MSLVEEHLKKISSQETKIKQGKVRDRSSPEASLQAKYPEYVRKDGKLNTRELLDSLKRQDRRQEKVIAVQQDQLQKQKTLSKAQELQLKEEATRMKLNELREKLKTGKTSISQSSTPDTVDNAKMKNIITTTSATITTTTITTTTSTPNSPVVLPR